MWNDLDNLDYVVARVHGMRQRVVDGNRLLGLLNSRSCREVSERISPSSSAETPEVLALDLANRQFTEIKRLAIGLSGPHANLVLALLSWYELTNLKILLRGFLRRISPETLSSLLLPWPMNTVEDVSLLMAAESVQAFAQALGSTSLAWILNDQDEKVPLHRLETLLDRAYFDRVHQALKRLPRRSRGSWTSLIVMEVDAYNIRLLARGISMYGLSPEEACEGFVPNGSLSLSSLLRFPSPKDPEAFGSALPTPFSTRTDSLLDVEDHILSRLAMASSSAFRTSTREFGRIVAFCYMKRYEMDNLLRLAHSLDYGFATESIRRRLIGLG